MLRVLQCHNFYQQPGGEDKVVADEMALLRSRGHAVEPFRLHNDDVTALSKLRLVAHTFWSRSSYRKIQERIRAFRPDVVHVHNTLPLISPSVYYAANALDVAVVQTLHNYRLLCPSGLCLHNGKICELCNTKRFKWPSVRYSCYRGSRAATAAIAGMFAVHDTLGTYRRLIDCYIACCAFARDKITESGIDPHRIFIKPNFLAQDYPAGTGRGGYVMFLGRLSHEKGVDLLLKAWETEPGLPLLRIIGDGPMRQQVEAAVQRVPAIQYMGRLTDEQVIEALGDAQMLAFPSVTYEAMPLTLLESFRAGTPVVASRLGAMQSIIEHGRTGRLFQPNRPDDLIRQVRHLAALETPATMQMRQACRDTYESQYTPDTNYRRLMSIYGQAVVRRRSRSGKPIDLPLPQLASQDPSPTETGETQCVP